MLRRGKLVLLAVGVLVLVAAVPSSVGKLAQSAKQSARRASTKPKKTRIASVKKVTVARIGGSNRAVITADGEVTRTGWTSPSLEAWVSTPEGPKDAVLRFNFVAVKPAVGNETMTPIRAVDTVALPKWARTVRVHAVKDSASTFVPR